jgi:hypothetical protein
VVQRLTRLTESALCQVQFKAAYFLTFLVVPTVKMPLDLEGHFYNHPLFFSHG